MSFLKAEWRNLAIINYEVDPSILKNHLPVGTELDLWQGKCFLSIVGFKFVNTKMMGIKFPFHVNFEEVNLRFYVKRFDGDQWKRGVVFIKEIVPKIMITLVANTVYNENYRTLKMDHEWIETNEDLSVSYKWKVNQKWSTIKVVADKNTSTIEKDSETEFITEHYWGYAKRRSNSTNEYEVTHPRWNKHEVKDYLVEVDFEATYGKEFAFLKNQNPSSVMLAAGSEITVESKKVIS